MKKRHQLIMAILLLFSTAALSAEELNYHVINLSGLAEQQIDNDIMVVTLNASAEASTAQAAAGDVNKAMTWASGILGGASTIKSKTMNYQTYPLYKNKAIIGWSAQQQLRLESAEIEELSTLVGVLQQKLSVTAMYFEISPARRRAAVKELITLALDDFRTKAQLVAETMEARDYRVISINLNQDMPSVPYDRAYRMEALAAPPPTAPSIQAGESTMTVRADGSIQLIF